MRRWVYVLLTVAMLCGLLSKGETQTHQANFDRGAKAPEGWTLVGAGRWEKQGRFGRSVSVVGTGSDIAYWRRSAPGLRPNSLYRLRFHARIAPGSATWTVISGLDVCNRDFGASPSWQPFSFVFTTPDSVSSTFLRLGQWHLQGRVFFDDLQLTQAAPVYATLNGMELGEGERVDGSSYIFTAPFASEGSNSARPLVSHTAAFNTNRWVFTGGSEVVYRHALPGVMQTGARIALNFPFYTGGECVVEASRDGKEWVEAARLRRQAGEVTIPSSLFPAAEVWIRLRGESARDAAGNSAPGAFQIDAYRYEAALNRPLPAAQGSTRYLEVTQRDPRWQVAVGVSGSPGRDSNAALILRLRPAQGAQGRVAATMRLSRPDALTPNISQAVTVRQSASVSANREMTLRLPYRWASTGRLAVGVTVEGADRRPLFRASFEEFVPDYYASDYGYRLASTPEGELWWCEAPYKVYPRRPAPAKHHPKGDALWLEAAGGEREHAQLILQPRKAVGTMQVAASDLTGPDGARIPKSAVEIREVGYVTVRVPTDRVGTANEWPDPLPPLEGGWKPRPNRNNPLWITITVPRDARAGLYRGRIVLRGARTQEVLIRLQVRGFSLPERTALRSGFGISPDNIRRYHNLQSAEAMEKVWDLYMQAFARVRLAPYNPMALAPFEMKVSGALWAGGKRVRETPAEGAFCRKIVDDSDSRTAAIEGSELIPVKPGEGYLLRWKCRTGLPGQSYMVSLGCYDAARNWIPYQNIDIVRAGSGEWQEETENITARISPQAHYVRIALRPVVWTEKGEQTGTAWFDAVSLKRVSDETQLVQDGGFETDTAPQLTIDFTAFDRAARRYLDQLGFNSVTLYIPGMGGGRYPNYSAGDFMGYPEGTPEYDRLMSAFGEQVQAHLQKNGWLSRVYIYWYDEPEVNDYPFVVRGMEKLRRYVPKLKRMMTEEFHPALYGHVDLWCPITPNFTYSASRARQRLGEEVWWYVCTGPKEPFCTLFIDHSAIELRMWLWQTWMYRVQGVLIWETTWWTSPQQFQDRVQNPWEDPMSYVADVSGTWGNGDGRFFYPPNRRPNEDRTTEYLTAPIVAMRWEMLGDGVEDWEYFRLLEGLVRQAEARGDRSAAVQRARRLLTVPADVCRDTTHFTTDPQPLLRHREAVAQAIETLRAFSRNHP